MPDADCEIQAKENMLFSGTAIANGTVIGIVTSTGMRTEIGKIQSQIQVQQSRSTTTCPSTCPLMFISQTLILHSLISPHLILLL